MSAIERVEQLLRKLNENLDALRAAEVEGIAVVAADPLRRAGLERLTQIAVQACIDLGDQVLALEGIEEPPRSRDVFPALAGAGLLDAGIAGRLAGLVGFCDVPAHEYLIVTLADLELRVPEAVAAASAFAQAMTARLQP